MATARPFLFFFFLLLIIDICHAFWIPHQTMTASSTSCTNKPMPAAAVVAVDQLPPAIVSTTPGTWAYDTMSRRVEGEILERTWQDNRKTWESSEEWKPVIAKFQALRDELKSQAKLVHLEEPSANCESPKEEDRQREYQEWHDLLQPYIANGDTWLSAPWMVTEFLVYRKLMQCLDYWNPNSPGYMYDPFLPQKRAGLESSVGSAEPMLGKLFDFPKDSKEGLELAASLALWGNKMDLSLWPADAANAQVDLFSGILNQASENLLHDDSEILAAHCEKLRSGGGGGMVDIIVDNAGFELVTDLALAQYLIESKIASVVTFQLKSHPTFVSDALEKDLLETVQHYQNLDASQFPNCVKAGKQWQSYLDKGQWKCHEDNFWVQPFAMWDMTEPLRSDMSARCDLAFVKGDANYRRLLGDRLWDYSSDSFQSVVGNYFPCPVCALRTLKAELGCGMDTEQVQRAKALDDQWLVNGRFGVIQFGTGATSQQ